METHYSQLHVNQNNDLQYQIDVTYSQVSNNKPVALEVSIWLQRSIITSWDYYSSCMAQLRSYSYQNNKQPETQAWFISFD